MKKLIALLLIFSQIAWAGLPPTSSKDSADTSNVTTFNYQFPNFTGTHTGTTFSLGALNLSGAGALSGNLPTANLNGGAGASGTTFFRGDGIWATPAPIAGTGITVSGTTVSVTNPNPSPGPSGNLIESNGTSLVSVPNPVPTPSGSGTVPVYNGSTVGWSNSVLVSQAQLVGQVKWTGCSAGWQYTTTSMAGPSNSPTGCVATPNPNTQALADSSGLPEIKIPYQGLGNYTLVYQGQIATSTTATAGESFYQFWDGTNTASEISNGPSGITTLAGSASGFQNTITYGNGVSAPGSTLTFSIRADVSASSLTGFVFGQTTIPAVISVYYFPTTQQLAQTVVNTIDYTGAYSYFAGSCPTNMVATNGTTIGLSGATYSGSTYQNLYTKIWGQAGLSTTSGQPYVISSIGASAASDWTAGKLITINLGGYFLRNAGGSSPNIAGAVGAQQLDEMQGHSHTVSNGTTGLGFNSGSGLGLITASGAGSNVITANTPFSDGTNGTPRTGLETRPINVAGNLCLNPQPTAPSVIITGGVSTNFNNNWRTEMAIVDGANCTSSPCTLTGGTSQGVVTRTGTGAYTYTPTSAFSGKFGCSVTATDSGVTGQVVAGGFIASSSAFSFSTYLSYTSGSTVDSEFILNCGGPR